MGVDADDVITVVEETSDTVPAAVPAAEAAWQALLTGPAADNSLLEPTWNVTDDDVDDEVFVTSLYNHNVT